VHTASIATTATSGVSHILFKNVDYALFRKLVFPGMMGCILGAYVLTRIPLNIAKPIIATYLLCIGLIILYKALRHILLNKRIPTFFVKKNLSGYLPSKHIRSVAPLATTGGFLDAVAGGGWGHIVTSTLLAQGATPHFVIGTVNTVQFFIAITATVTFFFTVGLSHWPIIIGLIIGGVIAAPIAAFMVRRINPPVLMLLAGSIVTLLSTRTLIKLIYF